MLFAFVCQRKHFHSTWLCSSLIHSSTSGGQESEMGCTNCFDCNSMCLCIGYNYNYNMPIWYIDSLRFQQGIHSSTKQHFNSMNPISFGQAMRYKNFQVDGLVQEQSNSIARALESSARKWLLECGFHCRVSQQYIISMNPFSITNTSPYLVPGKV